MNTELKRDGVLDGVRGWASVAVLLYHVFCDGFPATSYAVADLRRLLPFNGMIAVCLFFILSGYVLSIGFIESGKRSDLLRMAAARYPRLLIPIFAICVIVLALLKTGAIRPATARPYPFSEMLTFEPSILHLLQFSLFEVFFDYSAKRTFAGPLWTMSIELAGSFLVFGTLALVGRHRLRWLVYVALILTLPLMSWFSTLFVAGTVLAELRQHIPASRFGSLIVFTSAIAFPVFLPWEVWVGSVASVILICAIMLSPDIPPLLTSRLSAFPGRISFPLYLVHGPVMFAVGVPLILAANGDRYATIAVGLVVCAISVIAAVLFEPIERFAKRASRTVGEYAIGFAKR